MSAEILKLDGPQPSNTEIEAAVVGAILTDNAVWFDVSGALKASHFFEPVLGEIYEVAGQLIEKGQKVGPLALAQYFEADERLKEVGGSDFLYEVAANSVWLGNVADMATGIVDLSQRRELIHHCQVTAAECARPTIDDTASDIGGRLALEANRIIGDGGTTMRHRKQVLAEIVEDLRKPLRVNPTGISKLDEAMGGGLYAGKAYGIAARKKSGKTSLAATISYNLNCMHVRHGFIAGEMSPAEIEQKCIARHGGFNALLFLKRSVRETEKFQFRVAEAIEQMPNYTIYEHAPGLTFDALKILLPQMIHRFGISGFILDYLQLVGGKDRQQTSAEHLDRVAQWLADFCRKRNVWALVLAQMNQSDNVRGGEGMRLAFDQVYELKATEDRRAWLEMMDTRYTPFQSVGEEAYPALRLRTDAGPYFEQIDTGEWDDGEGSMTPSRQEVS